MVSGIINVNKPEGVTSFQVVALIKKKLKIKKVGHLGTLDPAGCGVLPIAVNKATKLFDFYLNKKKRYRAIFYFGKETDTLDSVGKVIKYCDVGLSKDMIVEECHNMCGTQQQIPPKYSAKSINGVRAYDLARNNVDFELKAKNVEVYNFELIEQLSENIFLFEIECSAGCYIRSLCRDLAERLGTVAYMPLIVRLNAGDFNINSSVDYFTLKSEEDIEKYIIKIDECLHFNKIQLDKNQSKKIKSGQMLVVENADSKYLLYDEFGDFFALGNIENKILKMEIYFGD